MPTPEPEERVIAGRYRLRSVLGVGSMGTVWAAFDDFLHRPVAVKEVRLPPGLPTGRIEEMRERTLREARAIAALSHPNVITLHDVVREDDEPFVVMEMLTARSLGGLLADHGPLSVDQAAAVGDALAAALEAAHAAGITHRDVKPGNVLVSADGRVKLTDFGIARNVSEVTMTSTGIMLGSPAYMAPEVASGKSVTPAADLWGLGATLFAAVEGRPPYDADGDPLATASSVVHDEVPRPSAGPLAELIGTLMSKDPAARPTPAEVRQELFGLLGQPGPLFPAELFGHDPDDEAAAGPAPAFAPTQAEGAPPDIPAARSEEQAEAPQESTAPLAADPGPLPFAPRAASAPAPRPLAAAPGAAGGAVDHRRAAWSSAAVGIAVILALVASAVAGFAVVRAVGGVPVLPSPAIDPVRSAVPLGPFAKRSGDASGLKGAKGGLFTVAAPADWTKFSTGQENGPLPRSTLVQFVSGDGGQLLSIERFPRFFAEHDIDDYLTVLEADWYSDDFVLAGRTPLPAPRNGVTITYRTVERLTRGRPTSQESLTPTAGPAPRTLSRTTFAQVMRISSSLWVVSVTVPTEQETRGRTQLFDRIAPTFTTTD